MYILHQQESTLVKVTSTQGTWKCVWPRRLMTTDFSWLPEETRRARHRMETFWGQRVWGLGSGVLSRGAFRSVYAKITHWGKVAGTGQESGQQSSSPACKAIILGENSRVAAEVSGKNTGTLKPHPAEQTRATQGLVPSPLTQPGRGDSGDSGIPRNEEHWFGNTMGGEHWGGWVFLSLSLCWRGLVRGLPSPKLPDDFQKSFWTFYC